MPGRRDQMLRTMLLCALTAAIFFLPFYIIDGGFFHYAGDFNSQQISFYRYMNGFIKGAGYPDGMAGAARSTFSWATDLGSGAMNAYSFYLYGSPFFWLSLIFPQNWLPYLMVPLLVLKFAVAGGGAYRYLCRYVRRSDHAVLGACLYAFSGFSIYNVFFNHFIDVVALFPWMLWALDETLYEQGRALRPLRVLGGGQPAQQLLLLHRTGSLPRHLLHLQADDERFPDECPPLRPAGL